MIHEFAHGRVRVGRMMLKLMYITNDINIAKIAQQNGIDRIWIDLERKGKEERQWGMNTVKSNHTVDDIRALRPHINQSELLVRINPWDDESPLELESVIDAGADIIMLPMWRSVDEVYRFVKQVDGRAKTMLLLETRAAEECLDAVLQIDGIDEIHIGLNDLHLEYGLTFMFELLSNGTVERICKKISMTGIPYGFGGVGRIGEGLLKADNIVAEHYRLGSSMVILSRAFCNASNVTSLNELQDIFRTNTRKMRQLEKNIQHTYKERDYENNRLQVVKSVEDIVSKIKAGR